jgi:tRNA pseudouridine55 synthase
MFGFLNIDKPAGPTSHDIVARVRRLVGRKIKVGHAGTLDPFATGVLVVCVGPATRLADYIQAAPKRYRTDIILGASSTTDDCQGTLTPTPHAASVSSKQVATACKAFVGDITQVPPAHSAVHIDGQRAYTLARAGERVDLTPRVVTVYALELIDYTWPRLTLEITCGSGTYIRAIARDIGNALGAGGYCESLRRLAVGAFHADHATPPDAVDLATDLADPRLALAGWDAYQLSPTQVQALRYGGPLAIDTLVVTPPPYPALEGTAIPTDMAALLDADGNLLALAQRTDESTLQPRKVFLQD